ncbi:transposase, partial [Escherichia coli]|nr:transposase [Escherichia coli]
EKPAKAAREHGISLDVARLPQAIAPRSPAGTGRQAAGRRGFVLLPRRWVVDRSFASATRCRRLVRDDERLPETVRGL